MKENYLEETHLTQLACNIVPLIHCVSSSNTAHNTQPNKITKGEKKGSWGTSVFSK